MKAIIYAGIGLISAATVYGVADYYNSQKNGSLAKLYVEEEISTAPDVEEKTTTVIPVKNIERETAKDKTVTAKIKSTGKVKHAAKNIKFEDFSRARIPEQVIDEKIKDEPVKKQEEIIPEKFTPAPAEKVVIKEASERKLNLDMYSRAPLKRQVKPVKKITLKG